MQKQIQQHLILGRKQLRYEISEVQGECILLQISPIRFISWRYGLFIASNIFIMIPWLLTYWYPRLKRLFYYDFCQLSEATDFYVLNYDEEVSIVAKEQKTFMVNEEQSRFYTFFVNRYMTYIIDENKVVRVSMYDYRSRISNIIKGQKQDGGLNDALAYELKNTYGEGTMIVEQPGCVDTAVRQILRPLYIFLLFSVLYWTFNTQYYFFSLCLFLVSTVGLVINLFQIMQLNKKIFHMAYYEVKINVLREGKIEEISSIDAVPGDIVFLKEAIKIPFEGIILEGSALINECALTGESVPVVKKADTFDRMANKANAIDKNAFVFEGTTIIQVNDKKKMAVFESFREKYGIPVCVVKTNFVTTKGQLVRIILFPKEQENIFQKESTKYLFFLFCLALAAFIALIIMIHSYADFVELFQKFIDLITITVPPALPVSMTFGIIYAIEKLQKKKIFCISQNKVIVGGMIEFCCFDKTGTLTEDFMDFYALAPANEGNFFPAVINNEINAKKFIQSAKSNLYFNTILTNMASNHSIIKIEATEELVGDPMEIKSFNFGDFKLNQSHADPQVIFGFQSDRGLSGLIYRRFEFDSDLQRMSVVCKTTLSSQPFVYVKGSPQMMMTIMDKRSIPSDYQIILKQYASHGFRVLAIASKSIKQEDMRSITRSQAESELMFNGFEVFENKLKPETKGAIGSLKKAEIKCVMITGDNTLTGSNISYKCEISDTGKQMLIYDFYDGQYHEELYSPANQSFQMLGSRRSLMSITKDRVQQGIKVYQPSIDPKQLITDKKFIEIQLMEVDKTIEKGYSQQLKEIIYQVQSKNCQLCLTGRAFNQIIPQVSGNLSIQQKKLMELATVFARTKPNDKAKIVMAFQHMDLKVSMCGDGANDCGALKQADIGLSLSQAEASISAPFTSQVANISSMVELIKECRCGLATNFTLFNVMVIYSLIQYTTTVLSIYFLQIPADFQYLYWDLALNFFFIIFIGKTNTSNQLSIQKPRHSLFSFTNIAQMMVVFLLQVIAQISWIAIYRQIDPIYYHTYGGMSNAEISYIQNDGFAMGLQSSIMFVVVNNIYVVTMIVFNISKPWREYFFTNIPLTLFIVLTLTYNQMLIFWREGSWNLLYASVYLTSNKLKFGALGVSWGFCLLILGIHYGVMKPFSSWLIRKYPKIKWL